MRPAIESRFNTSSSREEVLRGPPDFGASATLRSTSLFRFWYDRCFPAALLGVTVVNRVHRRWATTSICALPLHVDDVNCKQNVSDNPTATRIASLRMNRIDTSEHHWFWLFSLQSKYNECSLTRLCRSLSGMYTPRGSIKLAQARPSLSPKTACLGTFERYCRLRDGNRNPETFIKQELPTLMQFSVFHKSGRAPLALPGNGKARQLFPDTW